MDFITEYKGKNSDRWLSPALWADAQPAQWAFTGKGHFFFDDFIWPPQPAFTSATARGGYITFQSANCTVLTLPTARNGALQLLVDNGAGNLACGIQPAQSGMAAFQATKALARDMWFEARVRATALPAVGLALGLAPVGMAALGTLVNTTGALITANLDFVGFHMMADDADGIDAVYKKADVATRYNIKDVAAALVANTWLKLGVRYIYPDVIYYVDGVEVGRTTVNATNFPVTSILAPLLIAKNSDAADATIELDWWACAQLSD